MIRRILELITLPNLTKSLDSFNKGVQEFGKNMDSIMSEMSSDIHSSQEQQKKESKKNQDNLEKIFGTSDVKIWSDKKMRF